ncbi:MAG TPA: DUF4012 domain-containing protein [Actinomycetota bacterium]|nr:DUF4012 domain-containing protein [Actinomycetota bacterium]
MIYFEIGALILLIAVISVSDLIYRRVIKSGQRRRESGGFRGGGRFGAHRSQPGSPSTNRRPGPGRKASTAGGPVPGEGEFVRVKLRSGRVVEGWRAPVDDPSGGSTDAFDLDVSSAFDPNGNPMSFPSDSFIVFTSQVESLEVLDASPENKRSHELAAERQRSLGTVTTPISAVPPEVRPPAPPREEPEPAATPSADVPPEAAPSPDEPAETLGRVIHLPEHEDVNSRPAAVLAPAPEPSTEDRPVVPRIDRAAADHEPTSKGAASPRGKRRPRSLVWLGGIAALLLIALIVDGFFTFYSLSHALDSARGDLKRGSKALLAGHYPAAQAEFQKAATASGTADGLQGHPAFWVVSHLPRVNRDAEALRALGQSSDLASQAGLDAVQAIRAMGAPAQGLAASIYRHGQINLNASQRGEPFFVDIEDLLGRAYTSLRAAPQPVFGAVQSALSLALAKIAEAKDAIHKTRALIQALPSLFGRDQPRHYLLLFDNPSIARGSGGSIDFFGILTAKSGALTVGAIRPVDELPQATASRASTPSWFRHAYGPAGAFTSWEEVTQSPSFNQVGPVAQDLYQTATGSTVDGVIEMDPVALGLMTRAVGSLSQPTYPVKVNASNAVRVLTHDVYVHFGTDQHARDVWVAGLIEQVWKRVSRGEATAAELTTALGDSAKGSHFTMYSSIKADEHALNQVGVGQTFSTFEPNVQMAVTNNRTFTRLGYYERRASSTVVRLTRKGQAFVTTTFELSNRATKGLSRVLVHNVPSGADHTDLSLVLPLHAQIQKLSIQGKTPPHQDGVEGANPRVTIPLSVAPRDSVRVELSYLIPHALNLKTDGGIFRFATVPQATAFPDSSSVRVIPPDGYEVVKGGSVGGAVDGDSYVAVDAAGGPVSLEVKLAPPA